MSAIEQAAKTLEDDYKPTQGVPVVYMFQDMAIDVVWITRAGKILHADRLRYSTSGNAPAAVPPNGGM